MILVNRNPVFRTVFPDHTSQVWRLDLSDISLTQEYVVDWEYENEAELIHLAQLKDLLDKEMPKMRSVLNLPYLPYARQDKPVGNELTFALSTFAKLLNVLEFDQINVMDPHSEVAQALILNLKEVYPFALIAEIFDFLGADLVCYPDKGAVNKYTKRYPFPYVYGEKTRDPHSGKIKSYKLIDAEIKGKNILIIDDICDGGRTFILLAQELLERGASHVNLFVTHGLFSQGTAVLKDAGIERIFTHKYSEGTL